MAISSPGIGSNLDVNGIITKLMSIEAQPLTALTKKEATYQAKLSAYGSMKGALSSFQSAVQGLTSPAKFQALKASSSDESVMSASASSVAVTGSHTLDVSRLAQSQKLVVAGKSSISEAIGLGGATTLTFDFGTISGGDLTAYDPAAGTGGTYSGATFTSSGSGIKTVTIDASNNSLSGIRDAINNAKIGVSASIVNDGGASPYRLVLSSDTAGSSKSIKIDVSGDGDIAALLAHDPAGTQNLQQTVAAQNTELTVNGVFVSKASRTLTDVIHGVSLTANKIGTSTVSIARDSSAAASAVEGFVKAYNELNKTIKDLTSFNTETLAAGPLLGDASVRNIQSQMRGLLGRPLSGGAYTNLSQVGIALQKDGTMTLDSSKLQSAMAAKPADVAALFAATGSASDGLVSYTSATPRTQPGTYALEVSQIATQGRLEGTVDHSSGFDNTSGSYSALDVTVDGVAVSVNLSSRFYASAAELAMEIQSRVNGSSTFSSAGISVAVTESSGVLSVSSLRYGSASKVSISGAAADTVFGADRSSAAGLDVAGTLNGASGTGSGQYLTGATGNVDGLKVWINGGASGDRGTVSYSQGFAHQLDKLLSSMLSGSGSIAAMVDGTNNTIKAIGSQREVLNRRLAATEALYRKQFTALDVMIGNMTQMNNALQQQLASLPGAQSQR